MTRKHMVLGLSLDAAGHHPAAWRGPEFDAGKVVAAETFIAQGQIAEEAKLDFVLAGYPVRSSALMGPGFSQAVQPEPYSMIASLMVSLRRIGLAAQLPMAYWEPFNTARAFAALDNLSDGRSAWLAVPASGPEDAANFPRFAHQNITQPYERAAEYAGLVRDLWDSWEDEALRFDKANAIFSDHEKVHRVGHKGKYFFSEGPLNAPRPPQGHLPVLTADLSEEGIGFAAAHADLAIARLSAHETAKALSVRLGGPLLLADLHFVLDATEAGARQRAADLNGLATPESGGLFYAGTAEGLAETMAAWFSGGACAGFNLLPAVMPRDLATFAAGVVPLLRARGLFRTDYEGQTLRDHLGLARPANRMKGAA